ncbi:MAG: hypothetical protein JOZ39_07540, partial [Chloroflexi bacterium]|nr:hypothetical protein [Chloroflexota bacterium]
AGVFFAVIGGYYIHNDYGLPYRYTFAVADEAQRLARASNLSRIYVDGDMDPSEVMSAELQRRGLDVFWFDDYRTPEFAAPPAVANQALYLTMGDDTQSARFLLSSFGQNQVLQIPLPGDGVTLRGYVLSPTMVTGALQPYLNEPLDVRVANGLTLLAFHGDRRLQPGNPTNAAISWTWAGSGRPSQAFSLFAHLVDTSGKSVVEDDYPLQPAQDWVAGQTVVQWLNLPVPAKLQPGRYSLDVGIYAQDGVVRQALTDASGRDIGGSLTMGSFAVAPAQAAEPASPVALTLGDGISLLAHNTSAANGRLSVDLTWGVSARPTRDYTVYVHILDPAGKMIAQADAQPVDGTFPTRTWQPGDRVADSYQMAVPAGTYQVQVGMYTLPGPVNLGQPVTFGASST